MIPTPTPAGSITNRQGPGARGGDIPVRRTPPEWMDPTRWQQIASVAFPPDVLAALDKQDRGETLDPSERQALVDANQIVIGEVNRALRGEPFDPDVAQEPAQRGPIDPATGSPPDIGPPSGIEPIALPPQPAINAPFQDDQREPAAPTPGLVTQDTRISDPRDAPANTGLGTSQRPATAASSAPPPAAAAPPARPAPPAGGVGAQPNLPPPVSIGPPPKPIPTTPPATAPGPLPRPSSPPRAQAAPPAAPPARPAAPPPEPAAPPPPDLGPPPFAQDDQGPLLGEGPLRGSIERAGGRPTPTVARQVSGEAEGIRTGGYQGRTGGWSTLAQAAADAWERQYNERPQDLRADERAAYQRDPNSLRQTILDANSPFSRYRESWIGAFRAGEDVIGGKELAGQLSAQGDFQNPYGNTDASGAPREYTPVSSVRTSGGEPPPAEIESDGSMREYTPTSAVHTSGVPPHADDAEVPPLDDIQPPTDIGPPEGTDITLDDQPMMYRQGLNSEPGNLPASGDLPNDGGSLALDAAFPEPDSAEGELGIPNYEDDTTHDHDSDLYAVDEPAPEEEAPPEEEPYGGEEEPEYEADADDSYDEEDY